MKVLCNQADCQFWTDLHEGGIHLNRGRIRSEFEDKYYGICEADEIGISNKHIETHQTEWNLPVCKRYTQRGIVGHIDFSRFPQGGRIPENIKEI